MKRTEFTDSIFNRVYRPGDIVDVEESKVQAVEAISERVERLISLKNPSGRLQELMARDGNLRDCVCGSKGFGRTCRLFFGLCDR